jgi:hypothetical protein
MVPTSRFEVEGVAQKTRVYGLGAKTFGTTTLSITTLSIMTFSICDNQHKTLCIERHYAECRDLFIVILNVIMPSVIMLNVVASIPILLVLLVDNLSLNLIRLYIMFYSSQYSQWC